MRFADANIVLRYLLEDDQALSAKAAPLIEHQNIHVPFEVLAEIVYVMQGCIQNITANSRRSTDTISSAADGFYKQHTCSS